MRYWWLMALAACYRPVPPEGAPCASGTDCPTPLMCHRGLCVSEAMDDAAIPRIDAAPDAAQPTGCVPRWLSGPSMTAPAVMPNINSASTDVNPFVTSDGATFYYSNGADVMRATRTGSTFANAVVVTDLSSPAEDGGVSISPDQRSAFISTERTGLAVAGRNFWEATRMNTNNPFGNFTAAPFVNVNTAGNEYEIWASHDRLRVYVSTALLGDQTIALATRTTTTGVFSPPVPIAELTTSATECCHSLSADERVIVFSSSRTGVRLMYYATRSSPTDAFSDPELLPGAQAPNGNDLHTFLSTDACTLYFASNRSGGVGGFDIWTTNVSP